ncbi:MAG TPA: protein translocase subunit SecD [Moraxellaceae bacterium]|nr:protein translocase subunit SecD [Moraxellaceae bacterium]
MRVPLWKSLLILAVLAISLLYSLPNLYPDEPAVQVTGANASVPVNQAVLESVTRALNVAGIPFHDAAIQGRNGKESVLLRLNNTTDQLRAQDVLRRELGDLFVAALNLAPTTPGWLKAINAAPMKLGLDLRGGVHFLLEVDMSKALEQRQESYINDIKGKLREKKLSYRSVTERGQGFSLRFEKADDRQKAEDLLKSDFNEFTYVRRDAADGFYTDIDFTPQKLRELGDYAVNQNLTTIRNRVNELGVAESVVQRQGTSRIVVELPGLQDTAEAKRILGRTASLEFRLVDQDHGTAVDGVAPPGTELFPFKDNKAPPVLLQKRKIVTGDRVVNAQSSFDEFSNPKVDITLDSRGGKIMADATRDNVGHQMAVLFVESKQHTRMTTDATGKQVEVKENVVDKYVINRATIQSMLGSRFQITGLDSPAEAAELALLLRAGALAAPMYFVEERTIGPTLGQENIDKGMRSTQVGFALVAVFMIVFYRVFGVIANLALFFNVAIVVALMGALGAALSLPGIAGIVLTVGMAVDANVLIYERIREELKRGLSPHAAIIAGYDRAFTTIIDSHVTTLVVAIILWAVGSGPIKGFAVTLFWGILSSLFTSITVTRVIVDLVYGNRRVNKLSI